ncbi:hypothetical protein RD792_014171 [Penstemon davidsonii]|uniref:RING-type domain-containing protein n=1 Tax=Penstemon davidsonii TaxID=160366 RepID=A0ABR0CQ77_9LAMI|nr:hypothetical protein RD792_014171 [Penstemon davidsonii]
MKQRSSAHCVTQNKMFIKYVPIVEFAWESTIARSANSLMMTFRRINITVKNVESAELVAKKTISTVIDVYLFDTTRDITVLPCGHTIHLHCVKEMECHYQKLMVRVELKERLMTASAAADVAASAVRDSDIENHHNIPRESWDNNSQSKDGPSADIQDNDVGNIHG